jgi:hypothetical protein
LLSDSESDYGNSEKKDSTAGFSDSAWRKVDHTSTEEPFFGNTGVNKLPGELVLVMSEFKLLPFKSVPQIMKTGTEEMRTFLGFLVLMGQVWEG